MCDKCEDTMQEFFDKNSEAKAMHGRQMPCNCAECREVYQRVGRQLPRPTAEDRMTPELRRHLYTQLRRLNSCWANLHKFAGDPIKHKHWLKERNTAQQRIDAVFEALAENHDTPHVKAPATARVVFLEGVPAAKVNKIRKAIGVVTENILKVRTCTNAGIRPPQDIVSAELTARKQLDTLLDEITLKSMYKD